MTNLSNPPEQEKVHAFDCLATVISSSSPPVISKELSWDSENGEIETKTSANMTVGHAEIVRISNAENLAKLLTSLKSNQCMVWGIPDSGKNTKILSKNLFEKLGKPSDATTRSNKSFNWNLGPGILMLDFDYKGLELDKDQLITLLGQVIPNLRETSYVWWCSSSSYIYKNEDQINGLRGQRVYIFVKNARDIERAGKVLFDRLWLAGHGYYELSKAGSFLERTIIDKSVFQPSRLDFASGAVCEVPLTQKRPFPLVNDGVALDSEKVLLDLSAEEGAQLEAIKEKAKAELSPEAFRIRESFTYEKALENLKKSGIKSPSDSDIEQAKLSVKRALEYATLAGDFVIYVDDGSPVSIGEILDNPTEYHRVTTKDPIEPDYDGNRTVGILYLFDGSPRLFTQAHGGKSYRLIRQTRDIEHKAGRTFETVNATLHLMRELPDFYDLGQQLVAVENGQSKVLNTDLLPYYLASSMQFYISKDKKGELLKQYIDPPQNVVKQILALGAGRKLKPLKAVITAPIITQDDYIVSRPGYDSRTQLYLAMNEHIPQVPQTVDERQAKVALNNLMRPFQSFPYVSALDRSVCLAAVLTAVVRPVLDTSPAIAIDAPKQGTGKTYLARCIAYLSTGYDVGPMPSLEKNEEEIRKRLFSNLLRGVQAIIWDNVMGAFNSSALASFLTAPMYSDRILGKSETIEVPNKALFLITGNNLQIAGELPRRVLTCRLDAGCENPTTRSFSFNPYAYVVQNRLELNLAAITLIRGYLQTIEHEYFDGIKQDKLASFEGWDTLVRQVVAWIAQSNSDYEDPKKSIDDGVVTDPEHEILGELLSEINSCKGETWFTAKELCDDNEFCGPLSEVFSEVLHTQRITAKSVGKALSFRRDRIANGLKLVMSKNGKHAAKFKIESVK